MERNEEVLFTPAEEVKIMENSAEMHRKDYLNADLDQSSEMLTPARVTNLASLIVQKLRMKDIQDDRQRRLIKTSMTQSNPQL